MSDFKFSHKIYIACIVLVYFACTWYHVHSVQIECTPLKSCPTALKLVLTAKHSPETTAFLKISHCGVDKKNQPMVWCTQLNFCVTPQNNNGTCIPLKKCKPFIKLRSTLDPSNPEVNNFLNKFRCNEILEEPHVCCQNDPFESKNKATNFRTTTTQPKPELHGRFFYDHYDDYDWKNERSLDYLNFHDYYDAYQSYHHNADSETWRNRKIEHTFNSDYDRKDNKWIIPDTSEPDDATSRKFNENFDENNHRTRPGYDYSSEELWNNDKSGKSPKEVTTSKTKEITISTTTIASNYKPTFKKRNSTKTTEKQKNWTTPSTVRTTSPSYEKTTTTKTTDFGFNIGDGDIIFEDSFEDYLEGKSRNATGSSRSGNRRQASPEESRKSCNTPDSKPGVCSLPNNCQSYTILQNSLDRSLRSVRDYLEKFKCASKDEICCQTDEEKTIDNSLFNAERTNENIPDSISKICGRQTSSTDRIVGGRMADLGEFPWLALLQYPSNRGILSGCGGTLINSRYVVTAAHCVDEQILRNRQLGQVRQVVLGEYDTRNKTDCIYMSIGQDCADPPKIYRVESITPHKMYSSNTTQHDIALLRLDQEVTFTDYIKPICLPTKSPTLKGNETFDIAGWGRTSTDMFSPILRKAKIPSVAKENCNRRGRSLIDGQICAGLGNGTDSCNGDSGGPLMLRMSKTFEFVTDLVGIISYGFLGCGRGPSVNTYVPYYIDWINENMRI